MVVEIDIPVPTLDGAPKNNYTCISEFNTGNNGSTTVAWGTRRGINHGGPDILTTVVVQSTLEGIRAIRSTRISGGRETIAAYGYSANDLVSLKTRLLEAIDLSALTNQAHTTRIEDLDLTNPAEKEMLRLLKQP